MVDMEKVRKAHKAYVNRDGILMCEMEHSRYVKMEQELEELRMQLTPPTAEEVCKALSKYYHIDVEYDKRFKMFQSEETWYAQYENGSIDFGGDKLPIHIIKIIVRFYEGLENE